MRVAEAIFPSFLPSPRHRCRDADSGLPPAPSKHVGKRALAPLPRPVAPPTERCPRAPDSRRPITGPGQPGLRGFRVSSRDEACMGGTNWYFSLLSVSLSLSRTNKHVKQQQQTPRTPSPGFPPLLHHQCPPEHTFVWKIQVFLMLRVSSNNRSISKIHVSPQ